jgi:hypothetical protein
LSTSPYNDIGKGSKCVFLNKPIPGNIITTGTIGIEASHSTIIETSRCAFSIIRVKMIIISIINMKTYRTENACIHVTHL